MAESLPIPADLRKFFEQVFPDLCGLDLVIWTLKDKASRLYSVINDTTLRDIATLSQTDDVYVGCGLVKRDTLLPGKRGGAENIKAIPGLWADIDYGRTHKKQNLPPTQADALALIDDIGLTPSLIVHTGHGFHCWWLFKELWLLETPEDHAAASALSMNWKGTIDAHAKRRHWAVDHVHDLSRILRPPGTWNRKVTPLPTTIHAEHSNRYNPETDFDGFMIESSTNLVPTQGVTHTFTLNPDADPPAAKLLALSENSNEFRLSWNHQRSFPSHSEYDLSLATYMLAAEWTPQEIVDGLIANRRLHGADLELRQSKYNRTLNTAANSTVALERIANVKLFDTQGIMSADVEADPSEILAVISELIGLPIDKVINYTGDVSDYRISINGHLIPFGPVTNLTNQTAFWNVVADSSHLHGQDVPPPRKPAKWRDIHNKLRKAQMCVDMGPEGSSTKQVESYVMSYISTGTIYPFQMKEVADLEYMPFRKNGAISIRSNNITRYMNFIRVTPVLSINALSRKFTELGYQQDQQDFYQADKEPKKWQNRRWLIPMEEDES